MMRARARWYSPKSCRDRGLLDGADEVYLSESIGSIRARAADRELLNPEQIVELIAGDLVEVEAMFRENLASPVKIVGEIGDFVAAGGGKRVRPTLHLLTAQLCGYRGPHRVRLGTVLEFIHSATLIHDITFSIWSHQSLTSYGRVCRN